MQNGHAGRTVRIFRDTHVERREIVRKDTFPRIGADGKIGIVVGLHGLCLDAAGEHDRHDDAGDVTARQARSP